MKRICVFAGSNAGASPAYAEAAEALGAELAARGIELIYGGSRIGLMGRVADAALRGGGKVTGIMPRGLFAGEMIHTGLTEFREVADMHERKALMSELADAFVALPGGLGTFEELFEALSWSQLGIHRKPVGLLNVNRFFNPLVAMVSHAVEAGFAKSSNLQLFVLHDRAAELLDSLAGYKRPALEHKWTELKV